VQRDGSRLQLVVADNGPGIPAADRERALERSVRLAGAEHTPGSGLGLSLVAAVARMHHATLALEDNAPGLRVVMRFQ
jgi:signal transduction histidine kinase